MSESILQKGRWRWPGRCAVCGTWGWLKAWDEGLQGRVCTDCFDHVMDAETALASQGLGCPARAGTARPQGRAIHGGGSHPWLELAALWALWGNGVLWPLEGGAGETFDPERTRDQGGEPPEDQEPKH